MLSVIFQCFFNILMQLFTHILSFSKFRFSKFSKFQSSNIFKVMNNSKHIFLRYLEQNTIGFNIEIKQQTAKSGKSRTFLCCAYHL